MVLVGFEAKHFRFEDGKEINGYNLYTEEQRTGVTGLAAERIFIRDEKLQGYVPVIGQEIRIWYNRFGKAEGVQVIQRGS